MPLPKRYWKIGISRPLRLLLLGDDLVDLGERADKRLLADHVLAGAQRRDDQRVVHHRRGADVDDVEVGHREHVVEARLAARDAELVGERVQPLGVEVADRDDLELVGVGQVALDDVRAADAGADDRDVELLAHCCHTVPRSAIGCAVSASSIALKQRACGIAVSVRLSTSAMSWRP